MVQDLVEVEVEVNANAHAEMLGLEDGEVVVEDAKPQLIILSAEEVLTTLCKIALKNETQYPGI